MRKPQRCSYCGRLVKAYSLQHPSIIICRRTDCRAASLEEYLCQMEERRIQDEALNPRAYQDARNLSGYLSLYRFGNKEARERARIVINSFF